MSYLTVASQFPPVWDSPLTTLNEPVHVSLFPADQMTNDDKILGGVSTYDYYKIKLGWTVVTNYTFGLLKGKLTFHPLFASSILVQLKMYPVF